MSGKPHALVVMDQASFEAHLDTPRRDRLASLVTLTDPVWTDDLDSAPARTRLAEVEILLTSWGSSELTPERIDAAPALRAVVHCAGSVRSLIGDHVWARGIRVTCGASANAVPVAEYTLAAIIFAGKKAPFLAADPRTAYQGWSLGNGFGNLSNYRRTIGIVGFSRVGRRVLDLLRCIEDTTCLVADPYADPEEVRAAGGVLLDLHQLLPQVDVLSLHAPELPSTHHLIGAAELALLPDRATVINTARGSLIDSDALARECSRGRLFAILDVTDPEPLPESSPLRGQPQVMVTPHIAGSLGTEILRLTDQALDEIERWVTGQPLRDEVTPESLHLRA
jgi:phosphoglycerate dehydrogenase-like enzyme